MSDKVARDFQREFPNCWRCGKFGTQVHEIPSGGARKKARQLRYCMLALCPECHAEIHRNRDFAYELALKYQHDREHYDRSKVLEVMGRADSFVTQAEVWTKMERRATVLAIDPGPKKSGWVMMRGLELIDCAWVANEYLEMDIKLAGFDGHLAIEWVQSQGRPVGAPVFDTCRWVGRFQAVKPSRTTLVLRRQVQLHLCGTTRAKKPSIRRAILDLYPDANGGGAEPAIGTKQQPGPLYAVKNAGKGSSDHIYAAIGVAITYQFSEEFCNGIETTSP